MVLTMGNVTDDQGLADLADRCETISITAREAQYAAAARDPRDFNAVADRLLEQVEQLRTAKRRWLARGPLPTDLASF